ncbi:glycosyltransferase [Candidatus Dojkabacteria bacterium]|nr:glycosyltransferase [Candidatus Dojkabacteria bacterium]
MKKISIIVPVYNEEEVINKFFQRTRKILEKIKYKWELIFVNDGSTDSTLPLLIKLAEQNLDIKIINFSKNFGHQQAVTAGFDYANGDAVISIDADLQDPPELIPKLIAKWEKGNEVVHAKRKSRKDGILKILTATIFYKFLNLLLQTKIPENVGDYRLLDRKVIHVFKKLPEKNRYLRGLSSWVGFKQTFVKFHRDKRHAGKTKYSLAKMLKLASNAVFSFSRFPIRLARYLTVIFGLSSCGIFIYVLYSWIQDNVVPGWASQILIMLIFTSINLVILSIISEYVSRIYNQVQGRPIYIISDTYNINKSKHE